MNASPESTDTSAPAPPELQPTVDARNPWLGLVSFTEETRAFFFGREEEVAELARRVQRKLLTVLFGKSGLGKTSILRAGLVPRLREHGYCPVYVRIAYSRDTPEPAEQIKEAIRRASASGQWTQVGVAAAGESLWEFLHHRDDVLCDAAGATLTPLLIFDQFEEIFTLAQSDDFGRARAARFIEDLADLVENRPPKSLEARLDEDESAGERFDFARSDYRVLIALREDYLAPLESLKKTMPSLSQNRLRLAPMTGSQALEAVRRPGRALVSEEVAEAIVRFVAGGSELANAEVEPSLLSLICRELNDTRLAQGREEISLDLLAGSHDSILVNFYERSLADQPTAVRRIVEDELLTESGFRENVAEETLVKRFEAAGAPPGALATLVNRRLLRIEERLDVRRVELTHDVLCGVVKASRDQRHEREAREAAERVLEEQRTRERAARRALARARTVAMGCILLAALALFAAVFGYRSAERARQAERLAQENRALAEQARTHAERLLGYLAVDFDQELESFGQLKVIAQFTQRQIDYFHALQPRLRSAETVRDGALALTEHAKALMYLGDYGTGIRNTGEAIRLLQTLQARGDGSAATAIALGKAYTIRCLVVGYQGGPSTAADCHRAIAILGPLANPPDASVAARQAYVEALTSLGWVDSSTVHPKLQSSLEATRQAMRIATALGAKDLTHLEISAEYAEAGAWRTEVLGLLGEDAQALSEGQRVLAVADGVLARRPWYRLTLHSKQVIADTMANAAADQLDPREALRFERLTQQTAQAFLRLDPSNVNMLHNLGLTRGGRCDALWAQGRLDEALRWCSKAFGPWKRAARISRRGTTAAGVIAVIDSSIGARQVIAGDETGALRTAAGIPRLIEVLGAHAPRSGESLVMTFAPQELKAEVAYGRGDPVEASRIASQALAALRRTKAAGMNEIFSRAFLLSQFAGVYGRAEYQLGHFAAAASAERTALAQFNASAGPFAGTTGLKRVTVRISTWRAMALARQGKLTEAAQLIDPAASFEEGLLARDHGDVWVPYELARALYAQSLAHPAERKALLKRAAALLDELPPRLQRLREVRQWRRWVSEPPAAAVTAG